MVQLAGGDGEEVHVASVEGGGGEGEGGGGLGDGGGGDGGGGIFPEHPSPIIHAPGDIISRKGKSLTPIFDFIRDL